MQGARDTKITKNPLLSHGIHILLGETEKHNYVTNFISDLRGKKGPYEVPQSREKVLESILPGRIGEGFIRGFGAGYSMLKVPRKLIICGYQKNIFVLLKLHTKVICEKHLYKTYRISELGEALEISVPRESFCRFRN